jgi:hypothetical protein
MPKKANQEKTRKYGGTSSYVDSSVPSKAPRQDEPTKEFMGAAPPRHQVDDTEGSQGISNRPANKENPFPDSPPPPAPSDDAPDSVEDTPKQQGGNRGGV